MVPNVGKASQKGMYAWGYLCEAGGVVRAGKEYRASGGKPLNLIAREPRERSAAAMIALAARAGAQAHATCKTVRAQRWVWAAPKLHESEKSKGKAGSS